MNERQLALQLMREYVSAVEKTHKVATQKEKRKLEIIRMKLLSGIHALKVAGVELVGTEYDGYWNNLNPEAYFANLFYHLYD